MTPQMSSDCWNLRLCLYSNCTVHLEKSYVFLKDKLSLEPTQSAMDNSQKSKVLARWIAFECVPCQQRSMTFNGYPHLLCKICRSSMKIVLMKVSKIVDKLKKCNLTEFIFQEIKRPAKWGNVNLWKWSQLLKPFQKNVFFIIKLSAMCKISRKI